MSVMTLPPKNATWSPKLVPSFAQLFTQGPSATAACMSSNAEYLSKCLLQPAPSRLVVGYKGNSQYLPVVSLERKKQEARQHKAAQGASSSSGEQGPSETLQVRTHASGAAPSSDRGNV